MDETNEDWWDQKQFVDSGIASPITEVAVALAAWKGTHWLPSGTAVVVGPHLALTAKHVTDHFWQSFEAQEMGQDSAGSFAIAAIQILDGGRSGAWWSVRKIFAKDEFDLAFLLLSPFNDNARTYRWRVPTMNLLPPKAGSPVVGFGYHSSHIETRIEDGRPRVDWQDAPTTTTGRVVEVFHERRDSAMLTFPCYRVDARFAPGMSGGPVFDTHGDLRGIIASSMQGDSDTGEWISYVSGLWPAMAIKLDVDYSGRTAETYHAIELARRRILNARNWDRVTISGEGPGEVTSLRL